MLRVGIFKSGGLQYQYRDGIIYHLEKFGISVDNDEKVGLIRELMLVPYHGINDITYRMKDVSSATSIKDLIYNAAWFKSVGASAVAIPHGMVNIHANAIEEEVGIHVIRPATGIANEAKAQGLKRIALIGTKAIMESPTIKHILEMHGIEVVVPDELMRTEVFDPLIRGYIDGSYSRDNVKDLLTLAMINLDQKKYGKIEGCVLACTALKDILKGAQFNLPLLEITDLHQKDIAQRMINSMTHEEAEVLGLHKEDLKNLKTSSTFSL